MARGEKLVPFKPGESGNPNGRPKGSLNKKTYARMALSLMGEYPDKALNSLKQLFPGINKNNVAEFMIMVGQVDKAIRHRDTQAAKFVMDMAYGKENIMDEEGMAADADKVILIYDKKHLQSDPIE